MKQFRTRRVGELIKRELAEIFRQNRGYLGGSFITVTEVRLPRDMRSAEVWVSIFGDPDERQTILKSLSSKAGKLRYLLAGKIYLKRIPELFFKLDQTLDAAQRIDSLLKESGILEKIDSENEDNLDEQHSGTDS